MADARHKRKYPTGPRLQMTPEWKQRVLDALKANAEADPPREPSTKAALARAIGAHKTAIGTMLASQSSPLVEPVCRVLKIPAPMRALADDELESLVSGLSERDRQKVLRFIRDFVL